ncbi:MAG: dihydrofolate reductase [Caeruleum heppii]|nr:MAG: dihydrofolate reductase [Caeruleum heppii]
MLSLTLIVAATRGNGIGLAGSLPWPSLKSEMAFFARVTKRTPSPALINAVIMGRKTWESIPTRVRPLKDRINVIVSRRPAAELDLSSDSKDGEQPILAGSIDEALSELQQRYGGGKYGGGSTGDISRPRALHRVFIIGGSEIYKAAIDMKETSRVLLTRVQNDFDCDTFFPVDLEKAESDWKRRSGGELESWVGEEGLQGTKVENDVAFEFCMFQKGD